MSILIVRHGQTNDNFFRKVQIPTSPLSELGNQQARLLAQRLAAMQITKILSSDYLRARETASYIANLVNIKPEESALLRERHLGDLRGQLYANLSEDPFTPNYVPPNGESWAAFHKRVASAWNFVTSAAEDCDGDVLVVTHGLVCNSLIERQLLLPDNLVSTAQVGNTALTVVDHSQPWTISLLNCIAHLSDNNVSSDGAPV